MSQSSASTPPQNLKVLIADDSPIAAKIFSSVLHRAGYEVVVAIDGIAATQAVYREMPDVVLLDIFMPRMNGYQVCRLIKQDPIVSHIPVLINTASEVRRAEFWSLHTGADGFLIKGSPPDELLGAIARVIREKSGTEKSGTAPIAPTEILVPGPEEILSKVCALVDQELYATTIKSMEWKTMLENLNEGILTVNNAGQITSANHFLCDLLGVQEADLKARNCREALSGDLGAATEQLIQQVLQNGQSPAPRETDAIGQSGKNTPVEISALPVTDYLGEIVGAVGIFQDITRRRQIEALNQLKNELTDMIVHDLRTPLTSLLSGMQTLPILGEMNADQTEFLNLSIEGGQILLGMINDLLDISKMEDGSLHISRSSIHAKDLTSGALRQVTALAEAKGLQLIYEEGANIPLCEVDHEKLTRTLVNLLSNAIKFTPQGGAITLGTRLVTRPGRRDSIVFACRDTGEGIPQEAFERIFEKFGQVETRKSGRTMSSGLGLTFCKMVVEAHGGRIWVESTVGQGSNFSYAIPLTV